MRNKHTAYLGDESELIVPTRVLQIVLGSKQIRHGEVFISHDAGFNSTAQRGDVLGVPPGKRCMVWIEEEQGTISKRKSTVKNDLTCMILVEY